MNNRPEKPATGRHEFRDAPGPHLFWILLILFLALGTDYGFRLADIRQQHTLLTQLQTQQKQNLDKIGQMQETAKKVYALSVELAQIAPTNAAAEQIVKELGIPYTPPPSTVTPPATVSTNQNAQTNK